MKAYTPKGAKKFLTTVKIILTISIPVSMIYGILSVVYAVKYSPIIGIINFIYAVVWHVLNNFYFVRYITHLEMNIECMEEEAPGSLIYKINFNEFKKILAEGNWIEWPHEGVFPGSLFRLDNPDDQIHASIIKYKGQFYFLSLSAFLYQEIFKRELRKLDEN